MATLSDFNSAARLRDIVRSIAAEVVFDIYPQPRVATVVAVNAVIRTATVLYSDDVTPFVLPYGGIPPQVGALVRVAGKRGAKYVEEVLTRPDLGVGVSQWHNIELLDPFIASPGLQPPQWRREGRFIRFRGHIQSTTDTATRAFALIPPGLQSAYPIHVLTGAGLFDVTRNGVLRWDIRHDYGTLLAVNIPGTSDHTRPCNINARVIAQAVGRELPFGQPHWTYYDSPHAYPDTAMDDGRVVMSGLIEGGPIGASQVWTWYPNAASWKPAGGVWILLNLDGNGGTRIDIENDPRLVAQDVTNGVYLTLDSLEWVTDSSAEQHPFSASGLTSGWTDYGSWYAPFGHAMFGDSVYVRGLVVGTPGAVLATLPVGRRPPSPLQFGVQRSGVGGNVGLLEVGTDGTIREVGKLGSGSWVSTCLNFSITP